MPPSKISSVLAAFEANINENQRHGGATSKTFLNNIATTPRQGVAVAAARRPNKTSDGRPRRDGPGAPAAQPQQQLPVVEQLPTAPIVVSDRTHEKQSVVEQRSTAPIVSNRTHERQAHNETPTLQSSVHTDGGQPVQKSILRKERRFVANIPAPHDKDNNSSDTKINTSQKEHVNGDIPKRILTKPTAEGKSTSKRKLIRRKSGGGSSKKGGSSGRPRSRSVGKAPVQRSKSLGAKSRQAAVEETNGLLFDQIKRSRDILCEIASLNSRQQQRHNNNRHIVTDDGSSGGEADDEEDLSHTLSSVGTYDFNGSSVAFENSLRGPDDEMDNDEEYDDGYIVPIETPREHKLGLFERMKHWSEHETDADD